MEEIQKYTPNKNDKTEDIRIVTDFKDELERIKQKLASDFSKYSEMDKIKNKQRTNNTSINKDQITNISKKEPKIKDSKEYFSKIPTMEELKIKYGLVPNKGISSETQSNISTTIRENSNLNIINDIKNNQNNFIKKIDIKKYNNNDNIRNKKIGINNLNNNNNIDNYYNNTFNNQNILGHNEIRKQYIQLDNNDDKNNLILRNNNLKTIQISKTDYSNSDNYNYNFNYIDRGQRRNISPSSLVNKLSNNNTSVLLNLKLDQQIKIINEKSENNRLEEEKTQMKIREIENKLQLDERLTHNNREIRKNALKELSDMCQKDFTTNEDKQKAFEYFSPWIKYCLEETNSYVIPESLNFFIIFNSLFPNFLNISIKDFLDNVERYISFGINSINESCIKIFLMLFDDKKLYNQAFNELIKLLVKSSSLKTIKFLQDIIIILFKKDILQENYIKILFEKIIQIYSKIDYKNNEKKKIFEKIIISMYLYIEDDYQTIKKNIKLSSYKELDNLFNKLYSSEYKKHMVTYTLYPRPIQTDIDINNNDSLNNTNNMTDRLLSDKINNKSKSIYEKSSIPTERKNNGVQIGSNGEVNDIISVFPNEFFEYHFIVQFQQKMQILEGANEILNKIKFVKDKEKNLVDVYKTINYSIEDSNILIHLEGIKLLENICRLINKYINLQKLKFLLEACFEKLKDKKIIIKNELFKLFNIVIEYQCFELNKFISFILNYCSNERNDNSIIKLGLLEYIKLLFLIQNIKVQNQIDTITEKDYLYYTKIIVNIIEKESLSLIKDLCSDLLIIFKRNINSQMSFYDLIASLPNYRKKIIQNEEKNEMNESSYKKSLRQIRSSYSFSNLKNKNRNNRSINNLTLNNSNLNISRNDSVCSNSNFNKFKKLNIKTNNNYKVNNLRYSKNKNNKMNISFNNSPQRKNRLRVQSNENDLKVINKTEIVDENKSINKKQYKKLNTSNIKKNKINNNNSDSLEQRKKELLKSIENINEETIEKYSKLIIKDFLVFIKKACQQKKEDLSPHFELIFMIYEKIFNRIIFIMKENKNKSQYLSKYVKLIDELINYLTKILILAPGIQQIKGSSKFNILKLEKYLCVFQNFCFNKEKYYMHILLNLYKLCEGNDEDLPKKFDPKNSTIFFLNYIKKGNIDLNSKKILSILKQFIAETNALTLSEKSDLLEGIELNEEKFELDEISFKNLKINNKNIEGETNIKIDKNKNNINNSNNNINNKNNITENSLMDKKSTNMITNEEEELNNNNFDLPLKLNEDYSTTRLKKNDFDKIEESIRLMTYRLNSTSLAPKENINDNNKDINKNNSNNEIKNKSKDKSNNDDNHIRKNKVLDDNEIKRNMNALNIPSSLLKNKLSLDNKKNLMIKINTSNKPNLNLSNSNDNINSKKQKKSNDLNISKDKNNINTQTNTIKLNTMPNNSSEYIQTLNQIIKTLKNESTGEGVFNLAISQFLKLTSIEQKLEFINYLHKSLEKPIFIKNTSINILLNFYDFILSLLSFEILKFSNEESVVISLQALAQYLLNYRKLNDMFKVLLFLLKKYFPKDLNKKIEDISLVMIKVIAYLLKELLKNIKSEKVNGRDIICEINDLFTNTPPSTLTTLTPNCSFYQNIFTLLKSITDQIVSQDIKELSGIILYLKEKKIVCDDYFQYLIRLNNSLIK